MAQNKLATNSHKLTLQILKDLHKYWKPHQGQMKALSPLINSEDCSLLFVQCGRKWGKTDTALYILWRYALLHPGSTCYYIGPQLDHARKLIWTNRRLQKFGAQKDETGRIVPGGEDTLQKYITKVNESSSRMYLKNGSTIELIGSENWGVANGLTPDIAVYDEFKIFKTQWHTEFNPNRIVRKAPLVIIGTPPKPGDGNKDEYVAVAKQAEEREDQHHIIASSFENNYVPRDAIESEIEILKQRGEHDVIEREYYARLVYGGAGSIFPMFSPDRHMYSHNDLISEIRRDIKKLDWYCITDPGTTTCFAALFAAINPYTRQIYILDELYETDQLETSTSKMFPQMKAKMMEFNYRGDIEEDWMKVYDEAAAWFAGEVMAQYDSYFMQTSKHMNKKEHGISLVKDILVHDLVKISNRCIMLKTEMLNYVKDQNGKIPKHNDHLIDCFRYLLAADHYDMIQALEIIKNYDRDRGHSRRLGDDWKDRSDTSLDWTRISDKYYKGR